MKTHRCPESYCTNSYGLLWERFKGRDSGKDLGGVNTKLSLSSGCITLSVSTHNIHEALPIREAYMSLCTEILLRLFSLPMPIDRLSVWLNLVFSNLLLSPEIRLIDTTGSDWLTKSPH